MTFEEFKEGMTDLVVAFNHQISTVQLKVYFRQLKGFSSEILERGISNVLLSESRFPSIAKLNQACLEARAELWKEKKAQEQALEEKLIEKASLSEGQKFRNLLHLYLLEAQQAGYFNSQVCCELMTSAREGKYTHALAEAERQGGFKWINFKGQEIKKILASEPVWSGVEEVEERVADNVACPVCGCKNLQAPKEFPIVTKVGQIVQSKEKNFIHYCGCCDSVF